MRMVTWFNPDTGHTYVSTEAQRSGDYAIADKPYNIGHGKYDPDTSEWIEIEGEHGNVAADSEPILNDDELSRLKELSDSDDADKRFLANMFIKMYCK